MNTIPVVDLFAGPGGLGEGFSSAEGDPFRIVVSAEKDPHAHQTLRLRAFYRMLRRQGETALQPYYDFCNGVRPLPYDDDSMWAWEKAGEEALLLELGEPEHDRRLDDAIQAGGIGPDIPWVLIGGPPCQAYSLVGRSRNQGKAGYRLEDDKRSFLYREYLKIIQRYRPAVFVMENVKGILSASFGQKLIFHTILKDLSDAGYRIHSLSCPTFFDRSGDLEKIKAQDFVIKAEDYEIPQARHRVILLGVREGIDTKPAWLKSSSECFTVRDAIASLPRLRSEITKLPDGTKTPDDAVLWAKVVSDYFDELKTAALARQDMKGLAKILSEYKKRISSSMSLGGARVPKEKNVPEGLFLTELEKWYMDKRLEVWLNHEATGHMATDLCRYAFAAAVAMEKGRSPKGHKEFDLLDTLAPDHENWESGDFADRFKVQVADFPSKTVTSHISKDGHAFIHPDPSQCRSLTVREAARLQTFKDNYIFCGPRTQQFHQVGNPVPPKLAQKIAHIVAQIISSEFGETRKAA